MWRIPGAAGVYIVEIEVKAFGKENDDMSGAYVCGESTILIDAGMPGVLKRFGRTWKQTEVRLKHYRQ
ncbi:hypothetical protein [Bacillus spizizenii]|uniref:hypothetical protein n=1 Tax=Bacillus spizizenii TaxID=96241 RepID=UPI000AF46273|nr:hypothetical protein [Bacillus spizizenii]